MAKAKKIIKAPVGFPLEVKFTENGYTLLWDNRVRMSAVEYQFFCNYLNDHSLALLYFGAVSSQKILKSSPSLRFLHSLSSDFLRIAAPIESIDQLTSQVQIKLNQMVPQLEQSDKLSIKSLGKIYAGLIIKLKSKNKPVSVCIENIYRKSVAATSVSFSVEETTQNNAPFRLLICSKVAGKDIPLKDAAKALDGDKKTLDLISASVKNLASKSELIKKAYNNGDIRESIYLTQEEMYTFLKELEMYAMHGVTCRVPNRWKKHHSTLTVGMSLGKHLVHIGADSILNFDINLSIDGKKLTDEEIQSLLGSEDNLFMFHGRWVELKRNEMRSCLAAYESLMKQSGGVSLSEAMRIFLSPQYDFEDDEDYVPPNFTFDSEQWLENLNAFDDKELYDVSSPTETFTATLRPYQIDGVRWLNLMKRMGLGACLSDDMGLGKTVQAIAVLEQMRQADIKNGSGVSRTLIVIPASLLRNWQEEIIKFAPNLRCRVIHSSFGSINIEPEEDTNVFITTYAMLPRLQHLREIYWDCVILDEAQAIKNPQTLQSKAAKNLRAKFRLAMTGTPIENSITDLWSIFDFLNPMLFHDSLNLLTSITEAQSMNERVRNFVRPFILRRLKTDKKIISDLPEKIEMKNYCSLTQRQALLYKQVVDSLSDEITYMSGIERRGLVLTSILRLKQICNHPDQYTGHGAYVTNESGKLMRLLEICEDIKKRQERLLVFTQFREMCEPISNVLKELFGKEGLIVNGNTSIKERGIIVERFNDPDEYVPFIVLSLRAGGVGLNLTAANHVIHFDRWWNPAVENQATDRAFRIGQTNNVIVHKLICTGTLEEKIDKLIERKQDMAMDIVESDVKLTELSNEDLIALLHMEVQ